jgi:hypothetical protein
VSHSFRYIPKSGMRDPILKKPIIKKRIGGQAQGVGPEFEPQYHTHKKRIKKLRLQKMNFYFLVFVCVCVCVCVCGTGVWGLNSEPCIF